MLFDPPTVTAVAINNLLNFYCSCVSVAQRVPSLIADNRYEEVDDTTVKSFYEMVARPKLLITDTLFVMKSACKIYAKEFKSLSKIVCSHINVKAGSKNEIREIGGRPPKLAAQESFLSCILYLKHSDSARCESNNSKYSRTSQTDDVYFIYGAINDVMGNETARPSPERRKDLRQPSTSFRAIWIYRIYRWHPVQNQ